tara:strand:+ start:161 stop:325 length:165 start_codon:yes stop_codon:yes gene_type:complete
MGVVNGQHCSYCGQPFSCGCQKTQDEDGNTVHKSCVNDANIKIRLRKQQENDSK